MTSPGRPEPEQIRTIADLGAHLDALRRRAAHGTGKPRVPLDVLARELALPRSTVHVYVTGRVLPPAEVLDRLVIALGATRAEQRAWADAWFRVGAAPRRTPAPSRAPAAPTLPRQLPPAPTLWAGRAVELARLASWFGDDGRPPTVLLHGMPGVGKTALAVTAAYAAVDDHPDGQLYADLAGDGTDPLTPDTVLVAFLRALGADPGGLPRDTGGLAAAFRSWTAPLRLLVVLDNAADEAQVDVLLPAGPGCSTVVTSRHALAGLAVRHRCLLEPLPDDDATALLAATAGAGRVEAEPAASARVVQGCAGLPLALRIAGSRLAARPELRVADVAGRLDGDRERLDQLTSGGRGVEQGLDSTVRLLGPAARAALRRVADFGSPTFAPWLLAPLAGVGPADAARLADELVALHMIEPASRPPAAPRYRLHDLVRAHSRTDAPTPPAALEWVLALTAAVEARSSGRAATLVVDRLPDVPVALLAAACADPEGWAAAETDTVLAAVDRALEGGHAELAGRILTVAIGFLARLAPLDRVADRARRCADLAPDAGTTVRAALALAVTLMQRNEFPAAGEILAGVVDRIDAVPPAVRGDVLRTLGFCRTFCVDQAAAAELHRAALGHAARVGDVWGLAESHRGLSVALRESDPSAAREHGERAAALADTTPDRRASSRAYFGLARLATHAGDAERAVTFADRAWTLAQQIGDLVADGWCSVARAGAHRLGGDLDAARHAAHRALAIGRAVGRADIEAAALAALAEADALTGDGASAAERVRSARRLHTVFDSPRERTALARLAATHAGDDG